VFESKTDYPCAVTDQTDDGIRAGVRWCKQRADGKRVTLWVHQKRVLSNNKLLGELAKLPWVNAITARGGGLVPGGVVLAAYPDLSDISEIQRASDRITALCVVEWNIKEIKPWVIAIKPEILAAATSYDERELPIDPVVLAAMQDLTGMVGHGNTIAGGFDKELVVSALLALNKSGYKLDAHVLQGWAVANGWRGGNPEQLTKYINAINAGNRPRARSALRDDYVQHLERKLAGLED